MGNIRPKCIVTIPVGFSHYVYLCNKKWVLLKPISWLEANQLIPDRVLTSLKMPEKDIEVIKMWLHLSSQEVKNTCKNTRIHKHTLINNKAFIYSARDSQLQTQSWRKAKEAEKMRGGKKKKTHWLFNRHHVEEITAHQCWFLPNVSKEQGKRQTANTPWCRLYTVDHDEGSEVTDSGWRGGKWERLKRIKI